MRTLLEIADHIERLATQVKDCEIAKELQYLQHRAIEVEDTEDIFWLSLGGCLRDLSRNQGIGDDLRPEIISLALTCVNESQRLQGLLQAA